jgi:hypothetical protein
MSPSATPRRSRRRRARDGLSRMMADTVKDLQAAQRHFWWQDPCREVAPPRWGGGVGNPPATHAAPRCGAQRACHAAHRRWRRPVAATAARHRPHHRGVARASARRAPPTAATAPRAEVPAAVADCWRRAAAASDPRAADARDRLITPLVTPPLNSFWPGSADDHSPNRRMVCSTSPGR